MKKTIAISALAILIISLAVGFSTNNEASSEDNLIKKVVVQKVDNVDLSQVLNFSATVQGNKEATLSAKSSGRISSINVNIGDKVSNNDLLASLGGEESIAQKGLAYSTYTNSLAIYEKTKSLLQEQIADSEVAKKTAEQNLLTLKSNASHEDNLSEDKLLEAELQLEQAIEYKDNLLATLEQNEKNLYGSLETIIVQATILNEGIVSSLYSINGENVSSHYDEFYVNDEFIADDQLKINTQVTIRDFLAKSDKLEKFYNENLKGIEDVDVSVLLEGKELAKETLETANDALQDMNMLISDSADHSEMTQLTLDQYQSSILNFGSQVQNLMLTQQNGQTIGLIGIDQALANLEINKTTQLDEANKQIELTEQQFAILSESISATKDDLINKIGVSSAQLDQSSQSIATMQAQMELQLQVAKSQIDSAQGMLNIASVGVESSQINAPFSGVIAEKYLEEGTVVNAGTPVLKIADISSLKLVIYVPESEIKYFQVGQKGVAINDNYTGEEFLAKVERISPQTEKDSRKIRVELSLDNPDEKIKIGMFMNLQMDFEQEESAIMAIPVEALQDFYGESSVFVVENGKAKRKTVKTGISSDNYVEILEGLTTEDLIIIKGQSDLRDGDQIELILKDGK